jgi:hypothetical protein
MPALVAGIHVLGLEKTWMAGSSPAMTKLNDYCSAIPLVFTTLFSFS